MSLLSLSVFTKDIITELFENLNCRLNFNISQVCHFAIVKFTLPV